VAPRIRFFQGTRGARIAYATDGQGPLLVFPAWWVSHLEHDFDDVGFSSMFGRFAEHFTVVRYDRPGVGLSDRQRTEHSLEDELENLEALVRELGTERFALFGGSCGGPPAIAYAARHPERITHLVLYGAYACGPKLAPADLQQAIANLVRSHWGLGSKALTDLFAPSHKTEERQRFAESQRASASPDMAAALLELIYRMDVSPVVSHIRVPTLVLHRKGDRAIGFDHGRQLASAIPGATFAPLEGDAHLPWLGDWKAVADAALAFLAPSLEVFAAQLMGGIDAAASAPAPADPILDERARAEIRARLQHLDRALAEAEESADDAAAERSRDERDALLRELRVATGLGGRRRGLVDPVERARKAVSGRIRESIEKFRGALPELGRHLDQSITTGSFCAYCPPQCPRWRV
jgi:pimeloyl-ACP methyl ester carboxylesterase